MSSLGVRRSPSRLQSYKEEKEIMRKVKFMAMLAPMSKVKVVKEPVASATIKDMDALEAFLKGL